MIRSMILAAGILAAGAAIALSAAPADAKNLTVCPTGCAFTTIGGAAAAAASGDTLLVGPGHYVERVSIAHKNLTITGPAVGATNVAVLDAGGAGRPLTVTGRYDSQGRLDTAVVVARLTITGGVTSDFGGGAAALEASLTLIDAVVAHNASTGIGGGLYANGGVITLFHATVIDNANIIAGSDANLGGGGGIAVVAGSRVDAASSVIASNATTGAGGGLLATEAALKLTDVSVIGNRAGGLGGGIAAFAGAVIPRHVVLIDNAATDGGGAALGGDDFVNSGSLFLANRPNNCNATFTCH